jgi:hypothetical protein
MGVRNRAGRGEGRHSVARIGLAGMTGEETVIARTDGFVQGPVAGPAVYARCPSIGGNGSGYGSESAGS